MKQHRVVKRILCMVLSVVLLITPILASGGASSPIAVLFNRNTGESQTALERIMEETGFVYGVNVPWITHGKSLGNSGVSMLQGGNPVEIDNLETYERIFTNIKAIGFNAVSLWMFTNMEGIKMDSQGIVEGFDDQFLKNLDKTLKLGQDLDLPVNITLQPHLDEVYNRSDKHSYDVMTQCVVNPDAREAYIKKIILPLCDVLKKYESNLLAVTTYCEPEMDTYADYGGYVFGTSFDKVAEFVTEVTAAARKKLPNIPFSVASGSDPYRAYRYNDCGLDIIGVDVYNNQGTVPDVKASNVTKPMWMTEFGELYTGGNTTSNDFHMANFMNFLDNAHEQGYVGAFYWYFNGLPPLSMIKNNKNYSDLRPIASALRSRILDEQYALANIENVADTPSILYSDDPMYLSWMSSRSAETYTIEYSQDGKKFEILDTVEADKVTNESGVCSYALGSVKKQGVDYYWRVSVTTYEELKATSDVKKYYLPRYTCEPEDNLLTNTDFESGDYSGWTWTGPADRAPTVENEENKFWQNEDHPVTIRGQYSVRVKSDKDNATSAFYQTVKVKPNTVYHYYFYYFNAWSTSEVNFVDTADNTSFAKIKMPDSSSGSWTQCDGIFTTGPSTTEIRVNFGGYAGGTGNFVYLDDFYFFED